jgi:hypothetical protein
MTHKGDTPEILPRAGFKMPHKALRHAMPQQRPPHTPPASLALPHERPRRG